jgi:hypothetical protein
MHSLFYDDVLADAPIPQSIFLAGPTARGVGRTAWRAEALALLAARGFTGTAILPEFRDGTFDELAPRRFAEPASPIAGMRATSHNILHWETTGIERASVVLFWMPFAIAAADDPASLPGFTTRAEVSRELAREPSRVALGMPEGALSGSHIRYHAHRAGVPIAQTLAATVDAALALLRPGA